MGNLLPRPAAALVVLVVAGCGRVNFDRRADGGQRDAPASDTTDAFVGAIGCADGEREGFVDRVAFPTIAGCSAMWPGALDLRMPVTGTPCGDDLVVCAAPAAACAPGWHICATSGDVTDLSSRITGAECVTAGGAAGLSFVAAANHCSACSGGCTSAPQCSYLATAAACTTGAQFCEEPMCCGQCSELPICVDGAFPGQTGAAMSDCAANFSSNESGVMCCEG